MSTEQKPEGEKTPLAPADRQGRKEQSFFLRHIKLFCRLTGIAVLALLWAATVTTLQGNVPTPTYVGYYLLAASILITFLEITWILDKLACCVREGCCCRCWAIILWVDGWRKTILYSALSVPLFIQGMVGIIDIVSGFCLLVVAVLYLVKSFAYLRRSDTAPSDHEAIPGDTKPTAVITQETATQSEVTPASTVSTQTTEHPRNPFDEAEGVDLDEAEDANRTSTKLPPGDSTPKADAPASDDNKP